MKPEIVFKSAANSASVFPNEYGYTVNLHRRYQDRDTQQWKSTSAFRQADLPQVALLLQLATDYIATQDAFVQRAMEVDSSSGSESGAEASDLVTSNGEQS